MLRPRRLPQHRLISRSTKPTTNPTQNPMSQARLETLRSQFDEGDEVIATLPPYGGRPVVIPGVIVELDRASVVIAEAGSQRRRRVKFEQVQLVRRRQEREPKQEDTPMSSATPIARLVSEPSKPLTAKPFESLLAPLNQPAQQPLPPPAPPPPAANTQQPPPPAANTVAVNDFSTWLEMGRGLQDSAREQITRLGAEAVALHAQADAKLAEATRLQAVLDDMIRMTAAPTPQPPQPQLRRKRVAVHAPPPPPPPPKPAAKPAAKHARGPRSASLAHFVRRYPTMPVDQLCELAKRSGFPDATTKRICTYRWRDKQ